MPGQVNLGSGLGTALFELARLPEVQTALEVGTWNGEGSTLCIASGLAETSGRLYSIELDAGMYRQAVDYYAHDDFPVELIHGCPLSAEAFRPFGTYLAGGQVTQHEKDDPGLYERWYTNELELARIAPEKMVLKRIVDQAGNLDLVFLDGGEFTSDAEFEYLEPHISGFIVLDDTNPLGSIKNSASRIRILESPCWDVVSDELYDRAGWMVARKGQ
jgi:hypothetical protein